MRDKTLTNVRNFIGSGMTQYYKGERISELLDRIEFLKAMIDSNREGVETEDDVHRLVEGEATLVIMKAKLTALQGE
jgi:uncharacterized protein YdaL